MLMVRRSYSVSFPGYLILRPLSPDATAWTAAYLPAEELITVRRSTCFSIRRCILMHSLQTLLKAYLREAHIFTRLGNTATAQLACYRGWSHGRGMIPDKAHEIPPTIRKLRAECDAQKDTYRRHPDERTFGKLVVAEPELQVRGIWKPVRIGGDGRSPASRTGALAAMYGGAAEPMSDPLRSN